MPQRTTRLPLLANVEREAAKALAALHQEITVREKELATLKAKAARWQSVLQASAQGDGAVAVTPSRVRPSKQSRLDWSAILQELPSRFTTKDIAQKSGKPIRQVYPYVSCWMKAKKVRRTKDGDQKVATVASSSRTTATVSQRKPFPCRGPSQAAVGQCRTVLTDLDGSKSLPWQEHLPRSW